MRRAFEHPLAPALGCALVCVVYLLAQPATADMAAHSYRAWLFEHEGLTVWNAQWYGGHHVLGYSLLFAPLAAASARRSSACCSAVAAVALFAPLARAAAPSPHGGRGRRLAVHRRRAVQRRDRADAVPARDRARRRRVVGRRAAAGACSPACSALCDDARQPRRGRVPDARRGGEADRRRAPGAAHRRCGSALPTLAGGVALYLLFPEGGNGPLRGDRVLADARDLAPPASPCWRPGAGRCGPAACCTWACWWARSSCRRRSGRTRCGSACSPGRPCSRSRTASGCRSLALAVVGVGLLYLQWLPGRARRGRGARRPLAPGSPSRPRRGTSSRAWPSRASASRCR